MAQLELKFPYHAHARTVQSPLDISGRYIHGPPAFGEGLRCSVNSYVRRQRPCVTGGVVTVAGGGPESAAAGQAQAIIDAAQSQLAQTYCWDRGNTTGPTHGAGNGGNEADDCGSAAVGFDCSGLAHHAVYQATGIALPHSSAVQANASAYGQVHIRLRGPAAR